MTCPSQHPRARDAIVALVAAALLGGLPAMAGTASAGTATEGVNLASGANFADAMAGRPAAAHGRAAGGSPAPIVLVGTTIPAQTRAALDSIDPSTIVILGGPAAVSNDILRQLLAEGYAVTRIAEADRYETAAKIARPSGRTVPLFYLATGRRISGADRWGTAAASSATFDEDPSQTYIAHNLNWPDALAGSVLAGSQGTPILITEPNSIPSSMSTELDRLSPQRTTILGGTRSVSTLVEERLNQEYGRWIIE